MNSPRRSTSESVGDSPAFMTTPDRDTSWIPTIQPTETPPQTTSRGTVGRSALAQTATAATPIPVT